SPLHFVPLRLACGNPSMLGADFPQKKAPPVPERHFLKYVFANYSFFYFARYSFIAAAAFRLSPIGFCRFAPKLKGLSNKFALRWLSLSKPPHLV
ncbi:MAG: hypothetical protein SOT45_01325, partial [Treponema sp.]|nr:hypothetical protein [Treponema sp.]